MSVADTVRHGAREVIFESYPEVGFNYRLTDLQAAIGRVQLRRLPEIIATRRRLAAQYSLLLGAIPGVQVPHEPATARSNWQSYCIGLPEGCDQRRVMQHMLDQGISTRRGVMCIHREAPYADRARTTELPVSEHCQDTHIILPLFTQLTDNELQRVVDELARCVK